MVQVTHYLGIIQGRRWMPSLNPLHNPGLRFSTEGFKSIPVLSLYAGTGIKGGLKFKCEM